MALSIDTCNDIEKYEESVVAGLNAQKSICAVIAVACGGVFGLLLGFIAHLPMMVCVYGATPITCVIIVVGFYEKDGMNFIQAAKNKRRKNQNKPICYISTETKAEYEKHSKEVTVQTTEAKDAEFERIKKMVIIGACAAGGIFVLVIVLLVLLL